MLNSIVHRGPNDQGVHASKGACIGMRRLSIIDLAGGHQPISNEDETVWVVNNGEIYNYKRLRAKLLSRGHRFATQSDTEVIVHAYEEFGMDFLEHLDGMFALAIWDTVRRRLVVARDRLGIKPLYYHQSIHGDLLFASEVKALLASGRLNAVMDPESLQDYLGLGYAIAPRTPFKGVSKLAPGEVLSWEQGKCHKRRYWRLGDEVVHGRSEAAWRELIRAELERAMSDHMVSDVPLGAFLSGGIDSSTIVALMSHGGAEVVNSYAIGYAGNGVAEYYNELPFARQVADHYHTNHREIPVQPNLAELLPKLIWHLEEPISDTAPLTTYLVSELAAESVTVIMSGVGGDELFAGYNRYLGDHYSARYGKIPAWLRRGVVEPLAELLPSGRNNRLLDLARYAKQFVRSGQQPWDQQYRAFLQIQAPDRLNALNLGPMGRPDSFDAALRNATSSDPLVRLLQVDLEAQLPEALLLLSDKMTMAASLECRVPFLDHHLVELAATIPAEIKLKNGRLKHILKDTVADVLPADIIERRKRGFGAPIGSWVEKELRPLRDALLSRENIERRGMLAWRAVAEVCSAHDARREDYSDVLMVLMNLEVWSRVFLDGQSHVDVSGDLCDRLKAA
jgi:asparagine synthase (glutamine-hydrolysing)